MRTTKATPTSLHSGSGISTTTAIEIFGFSSSASSRAISTFLIKKSRFTVASGAKNGAVTLIQRFGSALNLNIHFHMLFLDGIYTFEGPRPTFHRAPRPTPAELVRLLHTISHRVAGLLERQGFLVRDVDSDYLAFEPSEALDQLVSASIHYRIAIGSNAGKKALTLRTVPAQPEPFPSTLLAKQPKKTPFRAAFVPPHDHQHVFHTSAEDFTSSLQVPDLSIRRRQAR